MCHFICAISEAWLGLLGLFNHLLEVMTVSNFSPNFSIESIGALELGAPISALFDGALTAKPMGEFLDKVLGGDQTFTSIKELPRIEPAYLRDD